MCRNDRALLFEDPTGGILYDPGRTVDEADGRLGDVHVMLLSHAHSDHIGDLRANTGGGTCAGAGGRSGRPEHQLRGDCRAEERRRARTGELTTFLSRKIQNIRGSAPAVCPEGGLDNIFDVPLSAPCTARPVGLVSRALWRTVGYTPTAEGRPPRSDPTPKAPYWSDHSPCGAGDSVAH